ncbi:MAG: short chain dehydrogenase [Shinella sp.]|nr:MAG: short chain dehydrogenase [Shinella sp.]
MANWTASDIPSQKGRSTVVTGTGGLGYEDALALARVGGEVIIAGRNPGKGAEAVENIRAQVPAANVRFEQVDLASLKSVAEFGARLRGQRDSLDLLINNAGVMNPPVRRETSDGFELQFGTNYLGHFALTAGLLPLLRKGTQPRVVTLSSIAARGGKINFGDLNAERDYKPMPVYSQSKLACLLFAFELQRRSEAGGWGVASMAAHPGVTATDLIVNGAGRQSMTGMLRRFLPFLFSPAWQGALPTLYAATSPEAKPGAYYGPSRMSETRGYPALAKAPPQALDTLAAEKLWAESERLTGGAFASVEQADRQGFVGDPNA